MGLLYSLALEIRGLCEGLCEIWIWLYGRKQLLVLRVVQHWEGCGTSSLNWSLKKFWVDWGWGSSLRLGQQLSS